jgi:serine/threonine protein phosphatase PrpC
VTRLSYDHKASDAGEQARVVAAGAVMLFGRVQGQLAITRAIGDLDLKQCVCDVCALA